MTFEQQLAALQRSSMWAHLRFATAFLLLGVGTGVLITVALS